MSVTISPQIHLQFFTASGVVASGYQLFTYQAGTTTKQATWTDSTQSTQNANPLKLDSQGRAYVWPDPALVYKYVLALPTDTDPPQSPVETVDNVQSPINLSNITQALIGTTLYPRTAAEIAAGVTPTNYAIPNHMSGGVVLAARYGATTSDATGATNAPAINNALAVANQIPGGAMVVLGSGNFKINTLLTGYSNTYLVGQGKGMGNNAVTAGTSITQLSASADVIDFPNVSSCGLRDIALIIGAGGGGIVWSATGTNQCYYFELENVAVDLTANAAGVGVWLNPVGTQADLYFPRFRNVTVTGGSGNTWGTKVGIRIGNSSSAFPVIYGDFSAILITNVETGLDLQNCQEGVFKGVVLYNISSSPSGSGIGIKGARASYNYIFGLMIEAATVDTYWNWSASCFFNVIHVTGNLANTATQTVDSNPNGSNQVYGDNGSSGYLNKFGPALNLYSVRSLTVGDNATPAGTAMKLYYATTTTVNPGAIAAGSTAEVTVSVGGLVVTDQVIASPQAGTSNGLVWSAYAVSGGYRIRIANVTGSSITPPSTTYNVTVFR